VGVTVMRDFEDDSGDRDLRRVPEPRGSEVRSEDAERKCKTRREAVTAPWNTCNGDAATATDNTRFRQARKFGELRGRIPVELRCCSLRVLLGMLTG
jgi:hypothetical protein